MRFAAVGDNCLDIYTNFGMVYPGGGAVNFGVHAARLGAHTTYIGAVGSDDYGQYLLSCLECEGVDISYVQRLEGLTAVAIVELQGTERHFIGADRGIRERLTITPKIDQYLQTFDLIHTTLDGMVDAYIPGWRAHGRKISYDFSHRFLPEQLKLLSDVNVAFFSSQHYSRDETIAQMETYYSRGAELVVMTRGEKGSIAFDGTSIYEHPVSFIDKVVDTLGAGDAFQAGFMTALMRGDGIDQALHLGSETARKVILSYGGFGHGRLVESFTTDRRSSGCLHT